jgi:hypothetical protein
MPHFRAARGREKAAPAGAAGSNAGRFPFSAEGCPPDTEQAMDHRIVETPSRASQGQKPAVTRYVLSIGLALVVILFVVAYVISV